MSRLQLALNVADLDRAVEFYSTLFATEPAKRKPGYANFAIADPPLKLVLFENAAQGGTINHLGVEVPDIAVVDAELGRLADAGLATTEERDTTCCYATQEKFWVENTPDALRWEVYTVTQDSETFFGEPEAGGDTCCADSSAVASAEGSTPEGVEKAAACC